jgi:hypothetical protein
MPLSAISVDLMWQHLEYPYFLELAQAERNPRTRSLGKCRNRNFWNGNFGKLALDAIASAQPSVSEQGKRPALEGY